MSGIAGVVCFDQREARRGEVEPLVAPIHHRGPDGISISAHGSAGLAHAALLLTNAEREQRRQPIWTPDFSYGITADARIYNREELRAQVGEVSWFTGKASDAELILASYLRWRADCLRYISGDFAFVIWDSAKRQAFLARDPFALKPLFYFKNEQLLAFGSEPKQLFVHTDGAKPNDEIVGEYLFDNFVALEQTFYKHIFRLRPGHYAVASRDGFNEQRYWTPSADPAIHFPDDGDYLHRFRELLKGSVRRRLDYDGVALAHISGGIDSTSVAVLCDEVYRESGRDPACLETVSMIFPQTPASDESFYSRAAANRLSFRHREVTPYGTKLSDILEQDPFDEDGPWGAEIQGGVFREYARVAHEIGARVMITGVGGDEIAGEEYYLNDLAKRGRLVRMVRDAFRLRRQSLKPPLWFIGGALRYGAPELVKKCYRKLPAPKADFPEYTNPIFAEYFKAIPVPDTWPKQLPTLTQQVTASRLTATWICWSNEFYECWCAHNQLEVRHPFLDRELADFVLRIPLERRLPKGRWKYLLRESMHDSLPAEIANRPVKTIFSSYERDMVNRDRHLIEKMLRAQTEWSSERYVLRDKADEVVFGSRTDLGNGDRYREYWRIVTIELWLRAIARHNAENQGTTSDTVDSSENCDHR